MSEMKNSFREVKWYKPRSSRKISFEIFIIGIDFIKKPEMKKKAPDFPDENSGDMPW
jgi:hypothetical protein